ncbi:TetR/AcrR family transcriptional regulator [Paucibacter sp. R3-3]|uniref:TetR/AcrR family transcriptional regulator n=1 Tax=Roseateles agri TaxID=3098619 RepID=A0ABU5DPI3_9BURK|nr:TetR/AcrR family transcriptional regulator [Paucibacter sp. R3-3]MDY0747631.1 TetR/AcrR family transcriptional regulator [Paucibacter sp. R3-3]
MALATVIRANAHLVSGLVYRLVCKFELTEILMAQRGRPRTFDRDAAVNSAMHLFWEQGFESTSLSQLKASMGEGISAPSFYAAFESKEALYKEALDRYMVLYRDLTRSLHDTSIAPREGVFLALQRSAKMQTESGHPKGCMVALGVMGSNSTTSDAVTQLLRDIRSRTRAGFRSCVERGIKSGELRKTTEPAALSIALDCFFQGLSVLARDHVRPVVIEKAVRDAMGMWDAAAA